MKNLLRPIPLAAAFLALGSVVHASIRETSPQHASGRPAFAIVGAVRAALRPGGMQPIDLALRNRTRSTLWITDVRVDVDVDDAHAEAGCSVARDFSVGQLPASSFPIVLPAAGLFRPGWPAPVGWQLQHAWALRDLGVADLPWIQMRNLVRTNQDACKGAMLRLTFTGTAVGSRTRAVHRR